MPGYSRQTVIAVKRLIRNTEARKREIEVSMREAEDRLRCCDCVLAYLDELHRDDRQVRNARTVRLR